MRMTEYADQVISHSRMRCFNVYFRQGASAFGGDGILAMAFTASILSPAVVRLRVELDSALTESEAKGIFGF